MRKLGAMLAVLVVATACADEGESHREGTMKTRPSQVRGSITGRVLNPLKEPITAAVVRVTLPSGVRSVPVDANGYFAVHNLPAGGTLPVRIEAEGHTHALLSPRLDAEAGEYPQNDISHDLGDVLLFPRSGELTVPVTTEAGEMVEIDGATCLVFPTWVNEVGSWVDSAGTDLFPAEVEPGRIRCGGLPRLDLWTLHGGTVDVFVPAQDFDGDGHAEYAGAVWSYTAEQLLSQDPAAQMLGPTAPGDFVVVRTNVPYLVGGPVHEAIGADEEMEIVFSQPIGDVPVVWMLEVNSGGEQEIEVSPRVEGDRLRISKAGGWTKGTMLYFAIFAAPKGSRELRPFFGVALVGSDEEVRMTAVFDDDDDDGFAAVNQDIRIEFSQMLVLSRLVSIPVQVDADLDGSGEIGDAPFELGNDASGFLSFSALYGILPSGTLRIPAQIPVGAKIVLLPEAGSVFDAGGNSLVDLTAVLEARE